MLFRENDFRAAFRRHYRRTRSAGTAADDQNVAFRDDRDSFMNLIINCLHRKASFLSFLNIILRFSGKIHIFSG